MSVRHLTQLLAPRSVAVIGASDRPAAIGTTVWHNLRAGAFAGPVFAVNPRHATLDGQVCHTSIEALPQACDLAIVCTPADAYLMRD